MRWAFWRDWLSSPSKPSRALPDDVGLPTTDRPPAAPGDRDPDDDRTSQPAARTSGATPRIDPSPVYDVPLTQLPDHDVDRTALAACGADLARVVTALQAGTPDRSRPATAPLAVAATGALAARLPALSGVDGAAVFDEPEDELLHSYADVLVGRTAARRTATPDDRDDLLAVAHLAAAAAAVDAAADPALLLLAGVPADRQLRAAALLLAQTADDGGGAPDRLTTEVRELFATPG